MKPEAAVARSHATIRGIFRIGLTVMMLAGVLVFFGCSVVRNWSEPGRIFQGGEPDSTQVLTECREAASLPGEEQKNLLKNLREKYTRKKDTGARFQLACLALQPSRSREDRTWARDLVRSYHLRQDPAPRADLAALAWLLDSLLSRQLNIESKLTEERARADSLENKLKALEDIEKIIRKREEGPLTPPTE